MSHMESIRFSPGSCSGAAPRDAVIECDTQPDGWMSHSITSSAACSCRILIMHTIGQATPSSTGSHELPSRATNAEQADHMRSGDKIIGLTNAGRDMRCPDTECLEMSLSEMPMS